MRFTKQSIISVIKSFLASGWTISYHLIKWWTSYQQEAVNSRFWKPFFTGCDDVNPLIVGATINGCEQTWTQVSARIRWPISRCQVTSHTIRAMVGHFFLEGTWAGDTRLEKALTSQSQRHNRHNTQRAQCAFSAHMIVLVRKWLLVLPIFILRLRNSHNYYQITPWKNDSTFFLFVINS